MSSTVHRAGSPSRSPLAGLRAGALLVAAMLVAALLVGALAGCSRDEPVDPGTEPAAPPDPEPAALVALGTLPGEVALGGEVAERLARRAPAADDWEAERLAAELSARLAGLEAAARGEPVELELAPRFECTPLRPEAGGAAPVGRWGVARLEEPAAPEACDAGRLRALLSDWLPGGRPDVHFHVVGVEPGDAEVGARVHVDVRGTAAERRYQESSEWDLAFERGADGGLGALTRLRLAAHVAASGPPAPGFVDTTRAVFGAEPAFAEQLDRGLEHWASRLDRTLGVSLIGHEGLAVGDADGDGLDDVFVCQPGGLPNRLFLRRADGTAEDASRRAGVDHLDASRSALFVDLDGDGDQDLVVEMDPVLLVMENAGSARFAPVQELPAPSVTSLSAADFDGDGDLDVYACGYMLPDTRERSPVPYHDANNGRPNALFRNDSAPGAWSFVDATREVGLDVNNRRFSFAAAWEDYDDDGDPDLYVANDFGRNNLYRNDGGAFTDVAGQAGVEDLAAGMGVTWTDYDGDGAFDLYVSNMFSGAGHRVAYQRRFQQGAAERTRSAFRRHARGNSLFRNLGDGTFADVSEEMNVTHGGWAWGSLACDLDGDGRDELVVPNGYVTGPEPGDL